MARDSGLGLDELMIVNPGPRGLAGLFLGTDGTLYQAQPLGWQSDLGGDGPYYLSADGMLYVQCAQRSPGAVGIAGGDFTTPDVLPSRHFLGADGVVYEVVASADSTPHRA